MDKWAKERPRRGHQNPSFSSTLLDAIFRSVDKYDGGGGRPDPAPAASAEWGPAAVGRPVSFLPVFSSSSSDSSSLGGFSFSSSSEHGSAWSHRARNRPSRSAAAARPLPPQRAASSPPSCFRNKIKASPIRIKARDPRRPRVLVSPGARLAGFLSSLVAMATGKPRKPKAASSNAPSSMAVAANYSRPCLLKTSSRRQAAEGEGLKRSVRFHLGANAVWGGEQSVQEGDGRGTKEGKGKGKGKGKRREEIMKRVEEFLRGLEEEEEEEEEEDMMSDSSSDLFELENLTAVGGGVRMDDELPVYSSTHLSTNRAISALLHL